MNDETIRDRPDTDTPEAEGASDAADTRAETEGAAEAAALSADAAEAEILRDELARVRERLDEAERRAEEMNGRFLRARADLENFRRRSAGDLERAREAGLDSAVLAVLTVYDDLGRALQVADEGDPSKIVPGVRAVNDALLRNLDLLGIERVGEVGEPFDPDLHEALTTVHTDEAERADTIAEVFQAGFRRGERLVRPARVVVYQG